MPRPRFRPAFLRFLRFPGLPSRIVGLAAFLATAALLSTASLGQTPVVGRRSIVSGIAPPAIQSGISPDRSHAPGSPEAVRRRSIRSASVVDRRGASGAQYRAGRVIVKFRDGASGTARVSAMSVVPGRAAMSPRAAYQDFDIVEVDPALDTEQVAQAFRARPEVEYAQAAYRVRPQFVPNDSFYPVQWNLPQINMEAAWDIQPAAGSAITVAVLDSGMAYTAATAQFRGSAFSIDAEGNVGPPGPPTTYPALGDITLQFVAATELGPATRFVSPHDFIWDDALPLDLSGHGTHVSGTIGQMTNNGAGGTGDVAHGGGTAGVAFNVKLMPVKVVSTEWDDIFGSPNEGTDDVVALGIRYAADNGAKVINMSIGRTGPSNCGTNPNQSGCAPAIEAAVRYAVSKGAFVAIAAGNEFAEGNPTEVIAEVATRIPGAVSVAGVNRAKGHAFYSTSGTYVELAAPGGEFGTFGTEGGILQQTLNLDLVETFDRAPSQFTAPRFDALAYFFFVGTSQATPHVSGVAAMLMQQGITDPAAVEAALERFAVDLGASGRDSLFGFGLVDARATLRGLGLAR
jgi:serine protease